MTTPIRPLSSPSSAPFEPSDEKDPAVSSIQEASEAVALLPRNLQPSPMEPEDILRARKLRFFEVSPKDVASNIHKVFHNNSFIQIEASLHVVEKTVPPSKYLKVTLQKNYTLCLFYYASDFLSGMGMRNFEPVTNLTRCVLAILGEHRNPKNMDHLASALYCNLRVEFFISEDLSSRHIRLIPEPPKPPCSIL